MERREKEINGAGATEILLAGPSAGELMQLGGDIDADWLVRAKDV